MGMTGRCLCLTYGLKGLQGCKGPCFGRTWAPLLQLLYLQVPQTKKHTNTLTGVFVCSWPQDLDPALISRFSTSVNFALPNESCR